MDSEHRHELKSNELATFLEQMPGFFRKYSNQIIGICLILIALIVIPMYRRMRQQASISERAAVVSKIQTAWDAVATAAQDTQSVNPGALLSAAAEDLKEAAETTRDANLAAMALLEESELLRAELHIRPDVSADTISANLSRARTACEQALEKAQTPTLRGLAELGLGLCDEEAGEYEQARTIYTKIIQTPEYVGTSVIEQAQRRLGSLDDNAVKVTFVKAPEMPADAPAAETTIPAEVIAPAPAGPAAP